MSPAGSRDRIILEKVLAILFAGLALFYFCYFIWTFFYDDHDNFQLIGRAANIVIFAYIAYSIHSDIRSRTRYAKDEPLYKAVSDAMHQDSVAHQETDQIKIEGYNGPTPD